MLAKRPDVFRPLSRGNIANDAGTSLHSQGICLFPASDPKCNNCLAAIARKERGTKVCADLALGRKASYLIDHLNAPIMLVGANQHHHPARCPLSAPMTQI